MRLTLWVDVREKETGVAVAFQSATPAVMASSLLLTADALSQYF